MKRLALVAALLLAILCAGGALPASADEGAGGTGISVTTTQAPADVVSGVGSGSAGTGTGTGRSSAGTGSTSSSGGSAAVVTPASPVVPVAAVGDFDLAGIVFISGITSDFEWSINPFGGRSHAQFIVHNVSRSTFDAQAGFALVGPFGNEVAHVDDVSVDGLRPDESRVVTATMDGIGQWGFFTTKATFTPPATVDGVALTSITRDGPLFVLPWFLLVLLLLAAGIVWAVQRIRYAGAVV